MGNIFIGKFEMPNLFLFGKKKSYAFYMFAYIIIINDFLFVKDKL